MYRNHKVLRKRDNHVWAVLSPISILLYKIKIKITDDFLTTYLTYFIIFKIIFLIFPLLNFLNGVDINLYIDNIIVIS